MPIGQKVRLFSAEYLKKHGTLIALGFFILISVIYFLPTILVLGEKLVGDVDAWPVFGTMRNTRELFLDDTGYAFSYVVKNVFHLNTVRVLLALIVGDVLGYNLVWLASFIFSGFAAFLLARYLTRNFWASLVGGFIFGFAPLHVAYSMGFGGAMHLEFIPLYVLFFLKLFNTGKIRYFIPTAIFFAFIMVNEVHLAVATLLLTACLLAYYLTVKREAFKNRRLIIALGVGIILATILLLTTYNNWIDIATSEDNYLDPGLDQATYYSNDVLSFLTPAKAHPIWGEKFSDWVGRTFTGNPAEYSVYVGIAALILSWFGWRSNRKDKHARFWLIVLFVFVILSLGPFLHFLGLITPKIPLPYLLLYQYIPGLENMRAVGRLFVVGLLALAMLSAYGFSYLQKRKFRSAQTKNRILVGLALLLAIEFLPSTVTNSVYAPEAYKTIGRDKSDFSIIEVPLSSNYYYASKARYYNTFHNKKVIGGYDLARKNWAKHEEELNTPGINNLLYFIPMGVEKLDILQHAYTRLAQSNIVEQNIKYILIDKHYVGVDKQDLSLAAYDKTKNFIETYLTVKNKTENEETIVYELDLSPVEKPVYLSLGQNWSNVKQDENRIRYRLLKDNSEIIIHNPTGNTIKINVDLVLRSSDSLADVTATYDEQLAQRWLVGPTLTVVRVDASVTPGDHIIKLHAENRTEDAINQVADDIIVQNIQYSDGVAGADTLKVDGINEPGPSSILRYPIRRSGERPLEGFTNSNYVSLDDILESKSPEEGVAEETIKFSYPFLREALFHPIGFQADSLISISRDAYAKGYYSNLIRQFFSYRGIEYFVIDKKYLNEEETDFIKNLTDVAGTTFELLSETDEAIAYRIAAAKPEPFVYLDQRWGSIAKASDRELKRYLKNGSTITVINPTRLTKNATLNFWSFTCSDDITYNLTLSENDLAIGQATANRDHVFIALPLTNLEPGRHEFVFSLIDKQGNVPADEDKCTRIYNLELINE